MDGRKGGLDPERGGAYSKGMNIEEKALSTFRTAPWRHNCAQAVCGALYGALLCTPVQSREELRRRFVEKLGYSHCRELKKEGSVPCRDCVASAAVLAFNLRE